jgi:transposase
VGRVGTGRKRVFEYTNIRSLFPSDAVGKITYVDRGMLETMLAEGLSLAEIGRRVGRHEATVGYWLKKYGLRATNHDRYASRGGIPRERLRDFVDAGMSIAEIATAAGRSKSTVRHWLIRYGFRTHGALGRRAQRDRAAAREANLEVVVLRCRRHGKTDFWLDARGYYRCKLCRSEAVSRRRRKVKEVLVAEAGGACSMCGYDRSVRALHFHHVEPSEKRHELSAHGTAIAIDRLRAEAAKCVLLCSNCHAEVEAGIVLLPDQDGASVQSKRHPDASPG